nr:aminodeoxychorismate/anthranilate synthase component II [Minwuia thermotolerans]
MKIRDLDNDCAVRMQTRRGPPGSTVSGQLALDGPRGALFCCPPARTAAHNGATVMILLIDNYDSFTYNLVHFLGELGAHIAVRRNDVLSVAEALEMKPEAIVLSPGPGRPDSAGISLELVASAPPELPILGVCLGHQTIGEVFGGRIIRAEILMHGKTSTITHRGEDVFAGLPQGFTATRYHSLVVDRDGFPEALEITAETEDGAIMGLRHRERPVYGVQFHPESIASEHGHALLDNFLKLAGLKQ